MSAATPHIPFDRLADLADGRLAPDEQAAALAHAAACTACAADLAWLRRTVGVMRADAGEDAPAHVVNRALRLFRPAAAAEPSPLRRLLAALQFDSQRAPLALGLRAVEAAGPRQLLYHTEECDIDLRLTPAGQAWLLSGQVLGPEAGGAVTLSGPGLAHEAPLNELGEFALPPVPAGRYSLRLRLTDLEIDIADLVLGAGA